MTAAKLAEITRQALTVTGPPKWPTPDDPTQQDELAYLRDETVNGESPWGLVSDQSETADYEPIDTTMATELIQSHLTSWLVDRGWQVQLNIRKQVQHWRLVDCLCAADGGGDRLEDHYPSGTDILSVLCAAVVVVDAG